MTQASPLPDRGRMTVQEYLRFELEAEHKHEFSDGEVIDMAGATGEHSLITMNLGGELRNSLKGDDCRVYDGNLRVRIHRKPLYRYPDLQVVCGPIEYDPEDAANMTALNPRLIVEVLSPSTEGYTRGEKFREYRQIPTLREYVLVSQHAPVVETFFMQEDGTWALAPYQDVEGSARFRSIDVEIPLREIFAGIEFKDPEQTADAAGETAKAEVESQ